MRDTGTRRGDRAVALLLRVGNAFGGAAASLDVHAPARLLQPDFPFKAGVASVGIHIAAGIAQVEQLFKDVGVRHGSVGDGDSKDQLVTLVDTGVQLVAKVILAVLFGPLRVTSFCARLCGFQPSGIVPSLTVSASSRLLR